MWSTCTGNRVLVGREAALVKGAVGVMVDALVREGREDDEPITYGIDWYDQWDWRQRLWLLDEATAALLTPKLPPEPAAIFDAAVDATFFEVDRLVEEEIAERFDSPSDPMSWRESVCAAFASQQHRPAPIDANNQDAEQWRRVITRLADSILGVRIYQQAESFRDREMDATKRFLQDKGLPDTYLSRIPPLRSIDQTQWSIDRIQNLVF